MGTSEANTMQMLPCGCRMGTDIINGTRTFLIEPCSLQCEYYLYALEESRKQGNTESIIDTR